MKEFANETFRRRCKERRIVEPCDLKIDIHKYSEFVERALHTLSERERKVITLRFLKPHTIAQIANYMNLSWREADQIIDRSVEKIRAQFRIYQNANKPQSVA